MAAKRWEFGRFFVELFPEAKPERIKTGAEILVVYSEAHIRRLVELNFKCQGYAVQTAATGREGLQWASSQFPDLIVLDWPLPDMPGRAFMIALRDAPGCEDLPVIAILERDSDLSAWLYSPHPGDQDRWLMKPFDPTELLFNVEHELHWNIRWDSPLN